MHAELIGLFSSQGRMPRMQVERVVPVKLSGLSHTSHQNGVFVCWCSQKQCGHVLVKQC